VSLTMTVFHIKAFNIKTRFISLTYAGVSQIKGLLHHLNEGLNPDPELFGIRLGIMMPLLKICCPGITRVFKSIGDRIYPSDKIDLGNLAIFFLSYLLKFHIYMRDCIRIISLTYLQFLCH